MNTERKLVTVRRIDRMEQIIRKDGQQPLCEIAILGGWKAMVSKVDKFKAGELVVFAEPDSVFPVEERWSFLEKCKYTIKTRKHNNMTNADGEPIISQGLVLKLDILGANDWNEGDDVTSILKVTHAPEPDDDQFADSAEFSNTKATPRFRWVPGYNKLMRYDWFRKISLPAKVSRSFPSEVSKTDEERIQNIPDIVKADTLWTLTEKVDGMSSTYLVREKHTPFIKRLFKGKNYDFIVCSRNLALPESSGSAQWAMAKKYNIKNTLCEIARKGNLKWLCIQGETIGPKIQNNRLALKENKLMVFNLIGPQGRIKSVAGQRILEPYGIEWVPIIAHGVNLSNHTPEDLLKMATGYSFVNVLKMREGIVFRAEKEGCNLSFKAVSPEYLLKIGE